MNSSRNRKSQSCHQRSCFGCSNEMHSLHGFIRNHYGNIVPNSNIIPFLKTIKDATVHENVRPYFENQILTDAQYTSLNARRDSFNHLVWRTRVRSFPVGRGPSSYHAKSPRRDGSSRYWMVRARIQGPVV